MELRSTSQNLNAQQPTVQPSTADIRNSEPVGQQPQQAPSSTKNTLIYILNVYIAIFLIATAIMTFVKFFQYDLFGNIVGISAENLALAVLAGVPGVVIGIGLFFRKDIFRRGAIIYAVVLIALNLFILLFRTKLPMYRMSLLALDVPASTIFFALFVPINIILFYLHHPVKIQFQKLFQRLDKSAK